MYKGSVDPPAVFIQCCFYETILFGGATVARAQFYHHNELIETLP